MIGPDEHAMWSERERTGKNVDQLEETHNELMRKVKRIDPLTIVETAEADYKPDGIPRVVIPFLHSWFVLEFVPYSIRAEHQVIDTLPMKVLVLQHIITAAENEGTAVRIMGQWIDVRTLRNGSIMGAHFAKTTSELLDRFFALEKDKRIVRAMQWAGKPIDLGDEGYLFKFFPRLPVAFIHWNADEEFPAYSKILYDVSASNYMSTHGLAALTEFLIHRLAE